MKTKTITFRILRYKPNRIDPPRFQDYSLQVEPDMSVLEALEKIRLEQDNTLMYRHSCHHSSCGTCACRINGQERLTCITRVKDLEEDTQWSENFPQNKALAPGGHTNYWRHREVLDALQGWIAT